LESGSPSLPRPCRRCGRPDDPVLDEQLVGGGLGQDVDARLLGLVGEEAAELGDEVT
jgi:hypothetical protein